MIIHFASAVIGFYLAKAALTLKWKQYSIFTLTFFALFSVSVKFRESLLGAGIYFVPSMSMYPTIKPGEFILIDSRAFADRAPMEADIVVFRHSEKSQWLVKRVTQWPENTLTKNKQFFLVGDNKDASFDSRQFGGVPKDSIVGKVELVLLGIDKNFNVVSFLKTID